MTTRGLVSMLRSPHVFPPPNEVFNLLPRISGVFDTCERGCLCARVCSLMVLVSSTQVRSGFIRYKKSVNTTDIHTQQIRQLPANLPATCKQRVSCIRRFLKMATCHVGVNESGYTTSHNPCGLQSNCLHCVALFFLFFFVCLYFSKGRSSRSLFVTLPRNREKTEVKIERKTTG